MNSPLRHLPTIPNKRIIVLVSRKFGTLLSVVLPSTRSEAAMSGNTAFFAPLMVTDPLKELPPLITNLSMSLICKFLQ